METLHVQDPAYVQERFLAIENGRQRRQWTFSRPFSHADGDGLSPFDDDDARGEWTTVSARLQALDAVWTTTLAEKQVTVMQDILNEMAVQVQHSLASQEAPDAHWDPPQSPSHRKLARKIAPSPTPDCTNPPILATLPMASQLGFKVFFRVCASLRGTMHGTGNARLVARIAAKLPAMLAKLPAMPLAPGVSDATPLDGEGRDESMGTTYSVFEELLDMLGSLLHFTIHSESDKSVLSLSDAERANILMAYVAVSLKWGRLRDLVDVVQLLVELPNVLSPQHVEQLEALVSELTSAEAVSPPQQLLPEEAMSTGYLVSFGKGDHGKLGHGQCTHAACAEGNCTENKNVPTVIASTRDIKFVKVDSLSTHSIAITIKGEVMAWGNGDKYRLGHGTTTKEYAPRIIDSLSLKGKVSDVACGLGHTLALMKNGDIYAWGNGSNGRLGLGDTNDRSNPTKVAIANETSSRTTPSPMSASTAFRYVVCGASHSLSVTSDGRVFAWGKNNQGQCGHGHTNDQLTAIEIQHFRDELNERIVWAAGGWEHTLFCSTSGRVYSCGCGYKDSRRTGIPPVLGHGDCEKRIKPTVVQLFVDANEEMVRVSCGWDHSLAISSQGALYTWGSGTNGKLGHGDEENCEVPTLVRALLGKFVKDAKAGCEHTVALTDSHELWTFGQGDSGRLGLGDTQTRKLPTSIDFIKHSGLEPVAIAVGDKYNLILADDPGSAKHQRVLESPGKHVPQSPATLRDPRSDNSSTGRSRRVNTSPVKILPSHDLKDLSQILSVDSPLPVSTTQNNSSHTVRVGNQNELLRTIAMNLARLASAYFSTSMSRAQPGVKILPYGIDTAQAALEKLLKLIQSCRNQALQVSTNISYDRALEIIIVCLRILAVNIGYCIQDVGTRTTIEPSFLVEVAATVNDLATMEFTPVQQIHGSDKPIDFPSLVREEAANVLQVGFSIFYPTTADKANVLFQLGICEFSPPQELPPRTFTLISKLCEDVFVHDFVLQSFQQAATHVCMPDSRSLSDLNCAQRAFSVDEQQKFPNFVMALLCGCMQDARHRLEESNVKLSEKSAIRLRLLSVLQGQWFAVALASLSISETNSPRASVSSHAIICSCCVRGLSSFIALVVDEAIAILKIIHASIREGNESPAVGQVTELLDSAVTQVVQASCGFLASLHHGGASYRDNKMFEIGLPMATTLHPSVCTMLEVLDEIVSELSNLALPQRARDGASWEKLGVECGLLCGQIASCSLVSHCMSENQLPGDIEDSADASTCFSDRFQGGITLVAVVLKRLKSPLMKNAVLLKLWNGVKLSSTEPGASSIENAATIQAVLDLCTQLTLAAGSETLSTRARNAALAIWLWIFHNGMLERQVLSRIICESRISLLTGEMVQVGPPAIPDHDERDRFACHSSPLQRFQASSRLRPAEDLVTMMEPRQALSRSAFEVFSTTIEALCASVVIPEDLTHPLRSTILADVDSNMTSMSNETRTTFFTQRSALNPVDTIQTGFDTMCLLLHDFVERRKRRHHEQIRFARSVSLAAVSQSLPPPCAVFLLASPVSVSASRIHTAKAIRLQDASLLDPADTSVLKAMSLWFTADVVQSSRGSSTSVKPHTAVVLGALAEATERPQESTTSTGSRPTVELSTSDRVRAVVFAVAENGRIRLGCALANHTLDMATSVSSPKWITWVSDHTVAIGRWTHVLVSCPTNECDFVMYVDGKPACCHILDGSERSITGDQSFGASTSRLQFVSGGVFDENLALETGISTLLNRDEASLTQESGASVMEVLIDDVLVFQDTIDATTAHARFDQGQTLVQLKCNRQDDQRARALLRLLNKCISLVPFKEPTVQSAEKPMNSLLARLEDDLFQLIHNCSSESSLRIALLAVKTLKMILPAAATPSRIQLQELIHGMSAMTSGSHDLGEQVLKMYVFSARAGVQSTAITASQAHMLALMRQANILTTTQMNVLVTSITSLRHVLNKSLVELVQHLSCTPAWQPLCAQLLDDTMSSMGNTSLPTEPLAVLAMVAGFSERFMNGQVINLHPNANERRCIELDAPWTSALRSVAVFESDSFLYMACQFGFDFLHASSCLPGASSASHDMEVATRTRIQSMLLRSIVGRLRTLQSRDIRQRLLSDTQIVEALLHAAVLRSAHIIKARLGPCKNLTSKLSSVQLLYSMLTTNSREWAPCHVVEELEEVASALFTKLESQRRTSANDLPSLLRQHDWREPKVVLTPLELLSGEVEIRRLTIRAVQHFPTVRLGRLTITVNSGLWYHEVKILTDGLMQIGYVDAEFVADAVQGQGVGDHTNSWAFDGFRRKKWNVSSTDYGELWHAGDVVGVLLDTDRMELSYLLNGRFLGVAFANLPLTPTSLLFPAISLNADQRVCFNFGDRLNSDASSASEGGSSGNSRLQFLPSLGSPLDAQRLRPVAMAIEESTALEENHDEGELTFGSGEDSDGEIELVDENADGGACSLLATPTTPPAASSFSIYHPPTLDDEHLRHHQRLPGSVSLHDDESELTVTQSTIKLFDRSNLRHDADDHGGDTGSSGDVDRKDELVQGLVNLGFPQSWATRCAQETSFTLSDTGAISWILEQMEGEAASSIADLPSREGMATERCSESGTVPIGRRAQDDSSLGTTRSAGSNGPSGRRTWQLPLSPSRDGRPHTEQFVRARGPLSSPSKQIEPRLYAKAVASEAYANPFLLASLASDDDDENDEVQESTTATNMATASLGFYNNLLASSLLLRFARLDLSTHAESNKDKEATPRLLPAHGDRNEEDVLPATMIAHSVLSLAYVRLIADALLFSGELDATALYPIFVKWVSTQGPGLFEYLRIQLHLHPCELPTSCSHTLYPSNECKFQTVMKQVLQVEFASSESSSMPLVEAVVAELRARITEALRDVKRAKTSMRSPSDKLLVHAMNARWSVWLLTTLGVALDELPRSEHSNFFTATRAVVQPLLDAPFINDLTKLAATATNASTLVWRNAVFGLLRELLSIDNATQRSPLKAALIPVHFLVELFATLWRRDHARRIALGEPIATLWETLLALQPLRTSVHPHEGIVSNELALRVEQVASTSIAISWECQEPEPNATSEEKIAAFAIENSVLSLSVVSASVGSNSPGGSSPTKAMSVVASGVPHFLPSKGSLVLRQLAPDTQYTIRVTKSSNPMAMDTVENTPQPATVSHTVYVTTPPEPVFELNGDAAGKNLVVWNRNRTVKNLVNKKWNTVRATVGFEEGVHHWHVRIDTCVSKNIFIGVCTADASLENYVGSDAFGYGFLANKAVWHNKSKISAYGEIFKQGDLLQVTLDCNARTLSYSRNGEFLGVAATNLHIANTSNTNTRSRTTSGSAGCKWYPAVSLYNKDDQLTLIVPPSVSSGPGGHLHSPSQHVSVLTRVEAARELAVLYQAEDLPMEENAVYTAANTVWKKWKQGDMCWREVGIGEIVEIDSRRELVSEIFGLGPGDSIFTSRGQCVVLGSHNHELWYELVDALELSANGNSSNLGSWSLSLCREMVSSPDEYPVHRNRRNREIVDTVELSGLDDQANDTTDQLYVTETKPHENAAHYEEIFSQCQRKLTSIGHLDALLVTLLDAIVAHRGLSSTHQLSHADLANAVVLHDVIETLNANLPTETKLGSDELLMRLAYLFYINQLVYRVIRLFLAQSLPSQWQHSVSAARMINAGPEADPDKERRETVVAAAMFAANLDVRGHSVVLPAGREGADRHHVKRRQLLEFMRSRLFETQREQLISEALRRSVTPTVVGGSSDPKATELGSGEDSLLGEPKDMLRLTIRLRMNAVPAAPCFWRQQQLASPLSAKTKQPSWWKMPSKELLSTTVFAQVSTQLRGVDPSQCRRQFASHSDSLAVFRSFQLVLVDPSNSEAASDSTVIADHTSQYLQFWDQLFTEIQSPQFPLFVPANACDDSECNHRALNLNVQLLLPEYAVQCGLHPDEALPWFYTLGLLLGMVWRAKTIVPLEFVSGEFWENLLDHDRMDDAVVVGADRVQEAHTVAMRAVREGFCSIVPYECLQLSTPQSLRSRLSDTDTFLLDRIHQHAIYVAEAAHHEAFWTTVRGFSCLERHALVRFLSGRTSSRYSALDSDDPIAHWKRQVAASAKTSASERFQPPPFRLELVDALADAHDHPDACFPVVHVVDAHCSRLHLPVYSSANVLRQKLVLAMSTLPTV